MSRFCEDKANVVIVKGEINNATSLCIVVIDHRKHRVHDCILRDSLWTHIGLSLSWPNTEWTLQCACMLLYLYLLFWSISGSQIVVEVSLGGT